MESPRGTSRVSAGMRVEKRLLVHKITLKFNSLSDNPEVKAKGGDENGF